MRSIFTFTIAGLILTACSQTPILPTATPLPSLTPKQIPTVTLTFSPTFTSTPPSNDLTPAAADVLKNLGPTFTMEQLNNPETIPFSDFDYLNSEPFAEAMVHAANHGLLPVPSANAVPIDHINLSDPANFDGSGFDTMFSPSYESNKYVYEDLTKRPWVPVLTRKTSVNGVDAYVTYFNVKNKDGSYGIYGMLDVIPDEFIKYTSQRLGLTDDRVPASRFFAKRKGCETFYRDSSLLDGADLDAICDWAMTEQLGKRESLFLDWADPSQGTLANKVVDASGKSEYYIPLIPSGNDRIRR